MARFEWDVAEDRIRAELASQQEQLQAPLGPDATNRVRGRIFALKWVLGLPDTAAPETPDTMIEPQEQPYD